MQNSDLWIHRYLTQVDRRGTREIQHLMLVEWKAFGATVPFAQADTFALVDVLLRSVDGKRVQLLIEQGKLRGEIALQVDADTAATLFIGMIQGLVIQAMLGGSIKSVRSAAPGAFAIYRRGIEQSGTAVGEARASSVAVPTSHPATHGGDR